MSSHADLRSYYEEEARRALRNSPKGFRTQWRADFVSLLVAERRRSVIDFGAGPGFDAEAFLDADRRFVGLDLAEGNARLAHDRGIDVIPGSMAAPPFRPASFDAGWSMSALMHVGVDETAATVAAMAGVLRQGSPLFVGLWGGERRDEIDVTQIDGQRRLFSLRPVEHNRELIANGGEVESTTVMDVGPRGWEYQGFLVRVKVPPDVSATAGAPSTVPV